MSRKGENIYKRKDGRWEGRYIKHRDLDGKRYYGYVYGMKYSQVKQKVIALKAKYSHHDKTLQAYEGSCEDWFQYWLDFYVKKEVKVSTYLTYKKRIEKHILPKIGKKKLRHLKQEEIVNLIHQMKEDKLSPRTINTIITLIKRALRQATKVNLLSEDPSQYIDYQGIGKKAVSALTINQQKLLEKICFQEKACSPVILSLYTGMRIGEISALKWTDIDFINNVIHIQSTLQRVSIPEGKKKTSIIIGSPKTESALRTIPISKNLRKYLMGKKAESESVYVITSNKGYAEPRIISHRLKRNCEKAGIEQIHFHVLRHTFATRCVENGVDIASLSKLLGHSSIKLTLDIYTDSMWESREKAIDILDKTMNSSFKLVSHQESAAVS